MEPTAEFLTQDELRVLTGYDKPKKQAEWLRNKGWRFFENAKGDLVVGRIYTRKKLDGEIPEAPVQTWTPDFSGLATA